jgi:ADP-ribosylglycohydrolase
MSLTIAKAIIESKGNYAHLGDIAIKYMQSIGQNYPYCGYVNSFYRWIFSPNPKPYNSYGNGAAMRVSAVVGQLKHLKKRFFYLKKSQKYRIIIKKAYLVQKPQQLQFL